MLPEVLGLSFFAVKDIKIGFMSFCYKDMENNGRKKNYDLRYCCGSGGFRIPCVEGGFRERFGFGQDKEENTGCH